MIIQGAYLNVVDNSGAKIAHCLKVLNGNKKRYAKVGDLVVVSIKSLRSKRRSTSKINKGAVSKAIVLRVRKEFSSYNDGIKLSFGENSVVLLNRQGKPLGTRIFGGIPKVFRYSKYMRLASLSLGLIK